MMPTIDLVKLLKSNTTTVRFDMGQVITREGERGDDMFFIMQGEVDVYRNYQKPIEVKMSELGVGDFFGETTMFLNKPRTSTVVAKTDPVVLVAVNSVNALQFLETQPEVTYTILKTLCQRLEEANDMKEERLTAAIMAATAMPEAVAMTGTPVPTAPAAAKNTVAVTPSTKSVASPTVAPITKIAAGTDLFPEGHKNYPTPIPPTPDDMVYSRKFECPLCNKPFTAMSARETKLKLLGRGKDFRNKHENIDLTHYEMVTCPHCYYSNFDVSYRTAIASRYYNNVNQISKYKDVLKLAFSHERQINEIFAGYYLALKGADLFFANSHLLVAKAWLRLSWLYRDCGDMDMLDFANKKAHKAYISAYENTEISPDAAQQISLIIGALSLRVNDIASAKVYYTKARTHRSGGAVMLKMAEDGIDEIRALEAKA